MKQSKLENEIKNRVLNLRHNEFSLGKIRFLGSDKDVFPYRIHILKTVDIEPRKMYSLDKMDYITATHTSFAIGELYWDEKDGYWEVKSVGMRLCEEGNSELLKWLADFGNRFCIVDGDLRECDYEE